MSLPALTADCRACAALCCVATTFERSEDFAFGKATGEPCPNLLPDHRCAIHAERREAGFGGCAAYDCHGAGQRATLEYGGSAPELLHAAFLALARLHEALWFLDGAARLCPDRALARRLERSAGTIAALAAEGAEVVAGADVDAVEARTRALLRAVGRRLRRAGAYGLPACNRRHD